MDSRARGNAVSIYFYLVEYKPLNLVPLSLIAGAYSATTVGTHFDGHHRPSSSSFFIFYFNLEGIDIIVV